MAPLSALCERIDHKLVHLNFRSYNGEIYSFGLQFQTALNNDYNKKIEATKLRVHSTNERAG